MISASAELLIRSCLTGQSPEGEDRKPDGLVQYFLRKALGRMSDKDLPAHEDPLEFKLRLRLPVVAIGAPAANYYPEVAERLGAEVTIPEYAEVCNAIGSVVSSVSQTVSAMVTTPGEGRYRVHLVNDMREFPSLALSVEFAQRETQCLAMDAALKAGAENPEIRSSREDRMVDDIGGRRIFIESRVMATAIGRPGLG